MPRFGTTPEGWSNMMQTLTSYLAQMGLTKERMKGYKGLETMEHGNLMDRMKQSWMYQISRDPELTSLRSQFFINHDPAIGEQIKSKIQQRADLARGALRGQLTPQMEQTLGGLVNDTYKYVIGETGATARQRERIEEVETPKLGLRGYEAATGRMGQITRAGELGLKRKKYKEAEPERKLKYYELVHKNKITPLKSYLQKFIITKPTGGSTLSEIGKAFLKKALPNYKERAAAEDLVGPMTPENLMKLISEVERLDNKVMQGQKLTDKDLAWISGVYDLFMQQERFESGMSKRDIYIDELLNQGATQAEAEELANKKYGIR